MASSVSNSLAIEDKTFLLRTELRPTRVALEFARADLILRDQGIESTIIVFGSARCLSPDGLAALPPGERTDLLERQAARYEAARAFGRIASVRGGAAGSLRARSNVIATGGGPGIMEAANRGASEVGAPTIGFNISLPEDQPANPYVTDSLSFRFHYFAVRKMHLAMRANALVVFPGGFGTLDELFEILTLQQTRKTPPAPIVLFDSGYWRRLIDFDLLLDEQMLSPTDLRLIEFADTPEEAWSALESRGLGVPEPSSATSP